MLEINFNCEKCFKKIKTSIKMEQKSKQNRKLNSSPKSEESELIFKCEWCNKSFYSSYTLKTHIQTAKYCLKQRGQKVSKEVELECKFCNVKFSVKSSFSRHSEICPKRKEYEILIEKNEIENLYKLQIIKLTEEFNIKFNNLDSTLKERNVHIEKLEEHIEKMDEYTEKQKSCIKELELKLAKGEGYIECFKEAKPQNITNFNINHKIKNVLTATIPPLTINLVKENVRNNYTYELFCKGETGLLTFIEGIIIKKNADLIEQNYACTDTSRNNCHILTQKDPVDWKLDTKSNFINKILDELVEPAEEYYKTLRNNAGIIFDDDKVPGVDEYIFNPSLSMDKNIAAEELYKKEILIAQQKLDKQKALNDILENINPTYLGITSEDKREELFKSVRNKVKNIASI